MARSRSFDDRVAVGGTYDNFAIPTSTYKTVLVGARGTCIDIVNNPNGNNPLDLYKRIKEIPGLDGVKLDPVTGVPVRAMSNFPLGYQLDSPDPRLTFPLLTTLQKNNYAWEIYSKANPQAPDYSVPTFLAELKDIPSLMRSWYGLFAKPGKVFTDLRRFGRYWQNIFANVPSMIAAGHLTWRWAIAPFIRDVTNMIRTQKAFHKRLQMLKKLATDHFIRRRVSLQRSAKRVDTSRYLHSEGIIIRGTTHDYYTEEVWGTVKYQVLIPPEVPLDSLIFQDNAALANKAIRLVQGITTYEAFATAWELMPWSWLVDWFTGFGSVIRATNNSLHLFASHPCLMRHTRCDTSISVDPALSETWATPNKEFHTSAERKERFLAIPVLPFAPSYLPLLERKAGLILGSLAILKVRSRDPLASTLNRLLRRK